MNKDKLLKIIGIAILVINLAFIALFAGRDAGSWISVGALAVAGASVLGAARLVRNQYSSDEA